jgi:uncharacterized protein (DUF427 family)
MLGGEVVADTRSPLLVWERPFFPTYYFPAEDVQTDSLIETAAKRMPSTPSTREELGDATVYTVKAGQQAVNEAAYRYADSSIEEIRNAIAFNWGAMDHWFEEDEEVYVHARNPYTRIDTLRSSRHVRVEVDGVTVADSHTPTLLFETGLPVRYYLPKTDVHMSFLTPTDTSTECPYKGIAQYWSVEVNGTIHKDVVWGYAFPTSESDRIAGLVSFYNEKVDIFVDGEREARPRTAFS